MNQRLAALIAAMIAMVWALPAFAQDDATAQQEPKAPEFLNVSLRDLADMEVTSVSKKREKASEAAAAIYVISNDDIRRSGANNLAEILRLAPGIQVGRAGSSQWAVSSRGFSDQFANKLLVLIDGRTIYSPTFSGVWWDIHNPVMEDIERIEVIRGPGASVWGANAVNGVINVITKSAQATQGSLAVVGGGNQPQLKMQGRHGFALSDSAWARVYASHEAHDEMKRQSGDVGNHDAWDIKRAGFRADGDVAAADRWTVQGDVYQGREDQRYQFPTTTAPYTVQTDDDQEVKGANVLGRWESSLNDRSGISVQGYLDYNARDIVVHDNQEFTADLDVQHVYTATDRYTLTWGAGYRYIDDLLKDSFVLDYDPNSRARHLFSGFFEHKLTLVPERWFLSLGSKFEHNDHTHFEHQPSARLSWLIDDTQTLWGAVSHAVRTPDRTNDEVRNPVQAFPSAAGTTVLVRRGTPQSVSEQLTAYEVGYRIQPRENLAIDSALFFNDYTNLIINQTGAPRLVSSGQFAPYIEVPWLLANAGEARSYGGEVVVNWQPIESWSLEANYSYLDIDMRGGSGSVNNDQKSPSQQFGIHSRLNLPHAVEFDQYLFYTDTVGTNTSAQVDDYLRLDLRVGYKPLDGVELSLAAQNLLDPYHAEFGPFLYNRQSEVGRSLFGQLTVRF